MVRFSYSLLAFVFAFQMASAGGLECKFFYAKGDLKLATEVLSTPADQVNPAHLAEVQTWLGLDAINFKYLQVLMGAFAQSKKPGKTDSFILIADHGNVADAAGKPNMVIPTAIASAQQMKSVPVTQYSDIHAQKSEYQAAAKDVKFWVKKLMAGTGSGITRVEFLKQVYAKLGKSGSVKIGSKGTDLHAEVVIDGQSHLLSIAELQILQLLAQSEKYRQVIFHDVVSTETQASIDATWTKTSQLLSGKSLAQAAKETGETRIGPTVQNHIPTIDSSGSLTRERMAPAGHGLFAIEAILSTLQKKNPKADKGEALIGVIGNGEDLMSTPSPEIIGWMAKQNVPLVMVTTEKTELDKQGGQIAIGFNSTGMAYATIVEKAQAEASSKNGHPEQIDLFYKLGLRENDSKAMFNTNMVLINYKVLEPKLEKLAAKVGGNEKLLSLVAPDLIANGKEQKSADGIVKVFTQLEGAMGSVVLKLDRLYRENFAGEPLVHFLNIGKENRTEFFAPIKTAFDFFMQFYSDRFEVDGKAFTIVDQRPGFIPKVTLSSEYYKEAANVLSSFKGTKVIELDELVIEGLASVEGLKLSGKVVIKNNSGQMVHIPSLLKANLHKGSELKNVNIVIDSEGHLMITAIK